MSNLYDILIKCPNTGDPVPTGKQSDPGSLKFVRYSEMTLGNCPACGGDHPWSSDDAFING